MSSKSNSEGIRMLNFNSYYEVMMIKINIYQKTCGSTEQSREQRNRPQLQSPDLWQRGPTSMAKRQLFKKWCLGTGGLAKWCEFMLGKCQVVISIPGIKKKSAWKTGYPLQNNGLYFSTSTKTEQKWIKDLDIKTSTKTAGR